MTTPSPEELTAKMAKGKEKLADLTKRHTSLRVTVAAEKQNADQLLAEAVAEYGVSTVEELKAELDKLSRENTKVAVEFLTELDRVDQAITDLERQVAQLSKEGSGL